MVVTVTTHRNSGDHCRGKGLHTRGKNSICTQVRFLWRSSGVFLEHRYCLRAPSEAGVSATFCRSLCVSPHLLGEVSKGKGSKGAVVGEGGASAKVSRTADQEIRLCPRRRRETAPGPAVAPQTPLHVAP